MSETVEANKKTKGFLSMRVMLTGCTGLLGSHLVEQLIARRAKVTALVRSIPQKSFLGMNHQKFQDQLEIIDGDLNRCQVEGVFDAVIHSAAKTSADQSQKDEIWKVNFEGTQHLYNSLKGRFGKWIQVSSVATLCDGASAMVDESYQGQARKTPYAESKLAADQWLDSQSSENLIVHPCYMLGRWDTKPSSGAILFALKFKKLKTFHNSKKNFVAAQDVAKGILDALACSARGHYLLGNENVELKLFFQMIAQEMNIPFDLQEEALSSQSSDWIQEFCAASNVNWSKARQDLGYQPQISLKQMISETMDFFEQNRMLKRSQP